VYHKNHKSQEFFKVKTYGAGDRPHHSMKWLTDEQVSHCFMDLIIIMNRRIMMYVRKMLQLVFKITFKVDNFGKSIQKCIVLLLLKFIFLQQRLQQCIVGFQEVRRDSESCAQLENSAMRPNNHLALDGVAERLNHNSADLALWQCWLLTKNRRVPKLRLLTLQKVKSRELRSWFDKRS